MKERITITDRGVVTRRDLGHRFEQDVRGVTVIPPLRLAQLLVQT
ncbi:MAG: hypothetical protein AB7O52_03520 [Planctomycetota bacterium]